jgi:pyrroloquinoline quinone biosynthesis protein D
MTLLPISRPRLNRLYRLRSNRLLYPEGIVTLNSTAVKILSLCDGERRIPEIKDLLFDEYGFSLAINRDINESFLEFYEKNWII